MPTTDRSYRALLRVPNLGRVLLSINYVGMPVGAALAGLLADRSVETAILVLGVGGSILAAAAAAFLVPRHDPLAEASA